MFLIARKVYLSCGWDTPRGKGGFNLTLEAYVSGPLDPKSGLIVNLTSLDKILKEVIEPFNHKHLQKDYPDLSFQSLEDFAIHCLTQIQSHPHFVSLSSVSLEKLRLYHSPTEWIEVLTSYGCELYRVEPNIKNIPN